MDLVTFLLHVHDLARKYHGSVIAWIATPPYLYCHETDHNAAHLVGRAVDMAFETTGSRLDAQIEAERLGLTTHDYGPILHLHHLEDSHGHP